VCVAALIPVGMWNVPLFSALNGYHTSLTDELWLCFTTLGDGLLIAAILGAFLVVNPRVTVLGLLILALSTALVHILKAAFPMPRPSVLITTAHIVGPLLKAGSFPSGHAAASMSAGLVIAHFAGSKKAAAVALVLAALVSVSRVFVGAHFPLDVLSGVICSLATYILVTSLLWPTIEYRIPDRPVLERIEFRLALAVEFVIVLVAMTLYAIRYAESASCAVMTGAAILVFLVFGLNRARAE
jgi:undecaprenyl-diphosphatase